MTSVFYIYLALQALVVLAAALYFRKRIPLMLWILTTSVYITMPLGILISGIASAFYLIDLLLPVMIIFSLMHNARAAARMLNNKLFLLFCALLFVVPMVTGSILLLIGNDILVYNGFKSHLIWFYRNTVLILSFGIAISSRPKKDQLKAFIEMNIVLGLCLALTGILNYYGPFNLSVFEMIVTKNDPQGYLAHDRMGAGFMGLFRGSVGQWFAILGIIAGGSYNFVSKNIKVFNLLLFISSITVILLSFSRAGIVGLATGMSIIVFFAKKNRFARFAVVVISVILISHLMTNDRVDRRFNFGMNTDYLEKDAAVQGRMGGWGQTLNLIGEQPVVLLFGVAPANDSLVYEKIGLYGSHNEYLNVFVKSGVFELLMLATILVHLLKRVKNKWVSSEDIQLKNINLMFGSVVCANIVMSFTQSHLLQDHATYTCIAFIYLLYGVFLGAKPKKSRNILKGHLSTIDARPQIQRKSLISVHFQAAKEPY